MGSLGDPRGDGRGFLVQRLQRSPVQAITLFQPVRDVVVHVCAGKFEAMPQQTGAGHAVHVIVTVNRDSPIGAQSISIRPEPDAGVDASAPSCRSRRPFPQMSDEPQKMS